MTETRATVLALLLTAVALTLAALSLVLPGAGALLPVALLVAMSPAIVLG